MANPEYSSSLTGVVKQRYEEKLAIINNMDPYKLSPSDLSLNVNALPEVSILDLSEYLIHTYSFCTGLQLKAYKGLLAYKYFEAGAVQSLLAKEVNDCFVVLSKVRHSQKFREKPLDVWVILLKDGSISTAHCTCMAGLGEACSHVATVLFYLMSRPNNQKAPEACTSKLATWPVPPIRNATMTKISDMNWSRIRSQSYKREVPEMTDEEAIQLVRNIREVAGVPSAICRIMEPFCSQVEASNDSSMPLDWECIFEEELIGAEYNKILKIAESYNWNHLSKEEIEKIEDATTKQSESKIWYRYRAGRITASKFKSVCRTTTTKPSLTTIKAVCYPEKLKFFSKHSDYGIKNEKYALQEYIAQKKNNHEELMVSKSGLIICQKYQQLEASPDALMQCKCCGKGCVEIKCPYLLSDGNLSLEEFARKQSTCLKIENGQIILDQKHCYYYQVQLQMFVTERTLCDLMIWSKNITFIERVYYNDDFCTENVSTALEFHKYVIIPELLSKCFSQSSGATIVTCWCICGTPDDGRPMIICDNEDCAIQWFHCDCVNLKDIPITWFCEKCSL